MEGGKELRYRRLMGVKERTVIVATDDGLIGGPTGKLWAMGGILETTNGANGVLMYGGHLDRHWRRMGNRVGIVNLTASVKGANHTRKVKCGSVKGAVRKGAEWVAVHVNVGGKHENEMISTLGEVVEEAGELGIPVMGIIYPRRDGPRGDDNYEVEKESKNERYVERVGHCVRIGAELGVDLVKTQYTGTRDGFKKAIEAGGGVGVVIAGGPWKGKEAALRETREAVEAGAAGVSMGRNIFEGEDPKGMIAALQEIVRGRTEGCGNE